MLTAVPPSCGAPRCTGAPGNRRQSVRLAKLARENGVRCLASSVLRVGTDIAPEVDGREWAKHVLKNRLPVMVHLWSTVWVPDRSAAMAPVVDQVAVEFAGRLDAGDEIVELVHPLRSAPPKGLLLAYEKLCDVARQVISGPCRRLRAAMVALIAQAEDDVGEAAPAAYQR